MERLTSHLVEWLETQVSASGGGGAVLGLSGGIDSAVVAALCMRAFADHTLGVIMPCESDPADSTDARLVAERFALRSCTVDLTATLHTFNASLAASCGPAPGDDRAAVANIKARLRMTTLYAFANHLGYRVIGTAMPASWRSATSPSTATAASICCRWTTSPRRPCASSRATSACRSR